MELKDSPARKIPPEQMPLLATADERRLASYVDEAGVPRSNGNWPGFGWEGTCVDVAVSTDSPDAMRWCHEQGFIDHDTKTFFNTPLRVLCEQRAPKCAKVLKALGYPA